MQFISAEKGPPLAGDPGEKFTVRYFDENGNMTSRSGGTRAWRCNNPGNLLASPYSTGKQRRSIGIAGYGRNLYAVYPDYNTGHEALVVMLKGSIYSPLSLRAAIQRYDSTNQNYINEIVKITKFDPERSVKSLNPKEFEKFWQAIEQIEKWEIGREDFIEKWIISGVHKKNGIICEYLVKKGKESFWLSKQKGIQMAIEGRLHAIVVHLANGNIYLRPEFGSHSFTLFA